MKRYPLPTPKGSYRIGTLGGPSTVHRLDGSHMSNPFEGGDSNAPPSRRSISELLRQPLLHPIKVIQADVLNPGAGQIPSALREPEPRYADAQLIFYRLIIQ
jgi:hypothetical protein